MLISYFRSFIPMLASIAATTAFSATVINFDDVAFPGGNPTASASPAVGYQGFDWGSNWVISPNDATGWFGGTVQPYAHSSSNFAWSAGGRDLELTVHGGGTFDLTSFWVRAWPNITFNMTAFGYLNGSQVYSRTASVTNAYSQMTTNFVHIDRLVLTEAPTANLLLDDLAVANLSPVPEPANAALFALGLAAVVVVRSRRAR